MRSLAILAIAILIAGSVPPATAVEEAVEPTIAELVGLNGHFHFKPDLYRPTTRLVRNYHNINWDVAAPGDPITVPVCVNKVHWDANLYGPLKQGGYEISLCAMFGSFGESKEGYRELWTGQEAWCRDYGEALASHFGSQGQESVTSIEIGNEPGLDFDDALYRSIFRNMAEGIRAGDPSIKIVTCTAQAREADTYAKDLRETFADPSLLELVDVLNVHTYAQVPRVDNSKSPWTRAYPESTETPYLTLVDEVVAWRDEHAPGKEIWITEFGYDACTEEAMKGRTGWFEKLDWQGVTDLQQAQYLVRSIMCFAQRPVDRAYIYFYDDKDSPSVHGCAGLTRNFEPKPSFHAIAQLQALLGDHRFDRVVRQDDQAYVYAFTPAEAGGEIWVAWSPTGVRTDRKDGYVPVETQITLGDLPASVERAVGMATTADDASEIAVTVADGAMTLTVGESPCYIVFAAE